jgi:Na+-translocating ferredoxin:NAD+ oxidoreductase subunit C
LERAKAQKIAAAQSGDAPKNIAPQNSEIKKEIAEIDARRQAVGLVESTEQTTPNHAATANLDKQAAIEAAIAKAKAAKAAKAETSDTEAKPKATISDEEKQAKIAAAVARAKAAKADAEAAKQKDVEKE